MGFCLEAALATRFLGTFSGRHKVQLHTNTRGHCIAGPNNAAVEVRAAVCGGNAEMPCKMAIDIGRMAVEVHAAVCSGNAEMSTKGTWQQ